MQLEQILSLYLDDKSICFSIFIKFIQGHIADVVTSTHHPEIPNF